MSYMFGVSPKQVLYLPIEHNIHHFGEWEPVFSMWQAAVGNSKHLKTVYLNHVLHHLQSSPSLLDHHIPGWPGLNHLGRLPLLWQLLWISRNYNGHAGELCLCEWTQTYRRLYLILYLPKTTLFWNQLKSGFFSGFFNGSLFFHFLPPPLLWMESGWISPPLWK
jgi:hypothetical protein